MRDFLFAWRSLARNRGFAATAVLSIALGIGANAAIFTIADQMLLRALPVKEPARLVMLKWNGRFIGGTSRGLYDSFSYPMYAEMCDAVQSVFTGLAARYQTIADLADRGPAERAVVEIVSGNYFETLGVTAAIGRVLTPEDDRTKDAEPYIVLSYGYWQRRFGGDPSVLNRSVDLNGHPMTVVGVAQRGFHGFESLSPSDVFVPLMMKAAVTPTWDDLARRNSVWLKVFARLSPTVSVSAARSAAQVAYSASLEADLAATSRSKDFAEIYRRNTVSLTDASQGFSDMKNFFARPLYVLLAMVATLLLIVCVNVSNLLLTRSAARQKEIAIRLSLGATRRSLISLVLKESLLLAGLGGVVGILLSPWLASLLTALLPDPQMAAGLTTHPDARVLFFTAGLTILAALLFGLTPAIQGSRSDIAPVLKSEAGSVSLGLGQTKVRRVLVAGQVALSVLLLAGAGLFATSLYRLFTVQTGIKAGELLAFSVDPSMHRYTPAQSYGLYQNVQRELKHTPGVVSVSGASFPLMANVNWENTARVEGYHPRDDEDMQAGWNEVLPGFFSTAGVPLLAGREFNEGDAKQARPVTIVNETFAKRFYPNGDVLGRHVGFGAPPNIEIVGVVKDFKSGDLKEKPKPWTYTAALQNARPGTMTFYVRTSGDPLNAAQAARQVVRRLDPGLPVFDVKTVAAQVSETHFIDRMFAMLSGAFAAFATLIASIGLFGITAYSVARRTQEIGIRLALGAARTSILGLVMREVFLITGLGVALGVPLAWASGRYVETQLYGVRANDPLVLSLTITAVALASLIAGYLPARKAARTDPMEALRYE